MRWIRWPLSTSSAAPWVKIDGYPDEEVSARAQVILLGALVQSADLDDAAITNLLNQARGAG
jgi:hypothetical protein